MGLYYDQPAEWYLYIGVTSALVRRVYAHREGVVEGFTKQYGLKMRVYFERHEDIIGAIVREKALKKWLRAWKVRLIMRENFEWVDLYPGFCEGREGVGGPPARAMTVEAGFRARYQALELSLRFPG